MSDISTEELRKKIEDIIKASDLSVLTSKTIREQLEKSLGLSLLSRKKQIDNIVMSEIAKIDQNDAESDAQENDKADNKGDDSSSVSSEEEKPRKKRAAAPARKAPTKKKRKLNKGSDSDEDDDSDELYKEEKKKPAKSAKASGAPRKGNGFTRPYTLSPELSALMGGESALPRHAVVKKIWSIVKERNLYDPKNKQFAICDDDLLTVMKVKRFRTFAMLKYLKPHFID